MIRPLVVEIVGPAGAGKTTLSLALSQRDSRIRTVLRLRRPSYFPSFVGHALLSLPALLRQYRQCEWTTPQVVRMMVHLKAMHQGVGRGAADGATVTVLDQGPVYMLARLQGFGLESIESPDLERWWGEVIDDWASRLDMVIQLDAPDGVLVERIRARHKHHTVKGASPQDAYRFLAGFRTSYERVLAKLTADGGPAVLRFNTHQESLGQIADRVLGALRSTPAKT